MFTGIVEELGMVKHISRQGRITLLEIKAAATLDGINIRDSIAVNGVCLTIVNKDKDAFVFEVIPETLKATNLAYLKFGDKVNLERALKLGDRLSGHFVVGHIDTVGLIRKKSYVNNNLCFEISLGAKFMQYIIPKGSIAVDGISLTVMDKRSATLMVYIIPHTLRNTTLSFKGPSDRVNIEFDILAKKVLPV